MRTMFDRAAVLYLYSAPAIAVLVGSIRPLRIAGVYPVIGVLMFSLIVAAGWTAGGKVLFLPRSATHSLLLAGASLLSSWCLISLLWVGIGAAFQATVAENYGRFLVLISGSVLVASGFPSSVPLPGIWEKRSGRPFRWRQPFLREWPS